MDSRNNLVVRGSIIFRDRLENFQFLGHSYPRWILLNSCNYWLNIGQQPHLLALYCCIWRTRELQEDHSIMFKFDKFFRNGAIYCFTSLQKCFLFSFFAFYYSLALLDPLMFTSYTWPKKGYCNFNYLIKSVLSILGLRWLNWMLQIQRMKRYE
jgi:hypothetical protein